MASKQSIIISTLLPFSYFPNKESGKLEGKRLKAEGEVTDSDSMTVVGYLDEFEAAVLDNYAYGGGVGVKAVLHQLFNGGYRPLNHLSCRDSVDHRVFETGDFGRIFWLRGFIHFHRERPSVANSGMGSHE